ncbi:radical SAM protein [Pelomonas sp. KK5]|uniref:radical SAM protein n=1 Tax=Pelomonas sp. KK5 TaxID=1855730 RepID=UPI00097C4337|nr:radical SAM protein [Pelomonas sp. KK5]
MNTLPFLQIEPTTRCNYSCGFCAGRHMAQGDLAHEQLAALLDQVEGLEHVELQGEGEPLLHPGFFEMAALLRERFPAVGISTITNGSLFNGSNIERLLDLRLTRLMVSMESAEPGRFKAIRGGSFERVERGLAAFMARRAARGEAGPAVGLMVTVLRDTVDEALDSSLPFYRRLGLDGGIAVQPLQAMPQYLRFYDAAMREQLPQPEQGRRFNERAAAVPDFAAAMRERGRVPGFYERLYASTAGQPRCPWLANGMFLAQDGHLNPCCFVKDSARDALARPGEALSVALERRAAMAAQLARGEMPPACEGCPMGQTIVSWIRPRR